MTDEKILIETLKFKLNKKKHEWYKINDNLVATPLQIAKLANSRKDVIEKLLVDYEISYTEDNVNYYAIAEIMKVLDIKLNEKMQNPTKMQMINSIIYLDDYGNQDEENNFDEDIAIDDNITKQLDKQEKEVARKNNKKSLEKISNDMQEIDEVMGITNQEEFGKKMREQEKNKNKKVITSNEYFRKYKRIDS